MNKECLVFSTTPGLVPAAVGYTLSRWCPQPSVGPNPLAAVNLGWPCGHGAGGSTDGGTTVAKYN